MNDTGRIPLPTLLSHVLTAFVIEFDNEFEHRVLAPTGLSYAEWRARRGFYLISLGGWATYLRHLQHGLSVADVAALARLLASGVRSQLFNLSRWGFVDVFPKVDLRKKIPKPDSRVELSPVGRDCWQLLAPLTEIVEARWRSQFGKEAFAKLCAGWSDLAVQVDPRLPDFLPIVSSRHRQQPFSE